jgi:hypothetical protein
MKNKTNIKQGENKMENEKKLDFLFGSNSYYKEYFSGYELEKMGWTVIDSDTDIYLSGLAEETGQNYNDLYDEKMRQEYFVMINEDGNTYWGQDNDSNKQWAELTGDDQKTIDDMYDFETEKWKQY